MCYLIFTSLFFLIYISLSLTRAQFNYISLHLRVYTGPSSKFKTFRFRKLLKMFRLYYIIWIAIYEATLNIEAHSSYTCDISSCSKLSVRILLFSKINISSILNAYCIIHTRTHIHVYFIFHVMYVVVCSRFKYSNTSHYSILKRYFFVLLFYPWLMYI